MARAQRQTNLPSHPRRSSLRAQIARAAVSPAAKTAYVVLGTAGLAALAIAIFGPKRFQREVLKPVQTAVGDQAAQLWDDSRSLREQFRSLFARAQSGSGRDRLVRNFQSWIGHFRAG
jgi:NAD/NADP transhydrogenase alpha subunit